MVIAALDDTERANFLHGQVRDLVTVAVEGMDGVTVTPWGIFTVAVGHDLLVRFKYVGRTGGTHEVTPAIIKSKKSKARPDTGLADA